MRLKCIAIATVLILGMMMIMSSCQPTPRQIHTYKVYLYDGSEYEVRASGYHTHYKYDSENPITIFNDGGGSFFNVKAVVQVRDGK